MYTYLQKFDWRAWLVMLVGGVALLLVIINIVAERSLRSRQGEVLARQAYIDESLVLSRLNGQIIQLLASLSDETNDVSIRAMLAQHGITFSATSKSADTPAESDRQ